MRSGNTSGATVVVRRAWQCPDPPDLRLVLEQTVVTLDALYHQPMRLQHPFESPTGKDADVGTVPYAGPRVRPPVEHQTQEHQIEAHIGNADDNAPIVSEQRQKTIEHLIGIREVLEDVGEDQVIELPLKGKRDLAHVSLDEHVERSPGPSGRFGVRLDPGHVVGAGRLERRRERPGPAADIEEPATGWMHEPLDVWTRIVSIRPAHNRVALSEPPFTGARLLRALRGTAPNRRKAARLDGSFERTC